MFRRFKRRQEMAGRPSEPNGDASPAYVEPRPFSLATEAVDARRCVIVVAGELDISTAPRLKAALDDAVASGRTRVVVDLADTSFVDSTSLAAIVGANNRLRSLDGALTVVNTDPHVAKMLEMTGFNALLAVHATRAEAVAAV